MDKSRADGTLWRAGEKSFGSISALAFHRANAQLLYLADTISRSIQLLTLTSSLAKMGEALTVLRLDEAPTGLALDFQMQFAYISLAASHVILRARVSTWSYEIYAGVCKGLVSAY